MNEHLSDEQLNKALAKIRDANGATNELTDRLIRERDRLRVALRANDDARDRLERRLDAVLKLHTRVTVRYGDAPDELACRACGTHYEYPVAWPCPTVKAAKGER